MAGITYIVGAEAALQELLHRSDATADSLDNIDRRLSALTSALTRFQMTFEENVQLLINYTKALKAKLDAIDSGATDAIIAGLQAEVAATAAALTAAQAEIAADTAQEEALNPQILELLAEPEAPAEPVEEEPAPEPEAPVEEEPAPEPEPGESDMFVPPVDDGPDMVA